MPSALEVALILVLASLAIGLLPLLNQLRRTAKVMDAFLHSATKDLSQIAEDIHASRLRMDRLVGSLQTSLDEFSTFSRLVGDAGRVVKEFHTRFQDTIGSAARNFGGILGGISAVMGFFKGKPRVSECESQPEP